MRAVVIALLVLTGLALPGCGRGPGDAQCRTEFADYHQMLGENGNPGTAAMPRLTKRWDALYDELEAKAKSAVSTDCTGKLDRLKKTVEGTQTVLFSTYDYDMVERLRHAESDLEHAERMRDYDPLPGQLATAFPELREAAPRSNRALAPQLAALDRVDPLDKDEIRSATRDLKAAARGSADYQRCLQALDVIGEFELDEE
jgi:hypothetical protein